MYLCPSVAPKQVISLIDPTRMELVVEVDEIDVPEVKVGQKVIITLDALPDEEFSGAVTTIFPVPLEVGGVIVYEVEIELDVPEDSGVRIGMSAEADIVLASRTDALTRARAILDARAGERLFSLPVLAKAASA